MTFTSVGFLIAIAPLLVLVSLLLTRRFPGEAVIQKLRSLIDLILLGFDFCSVFSIESSIRDYLARGGGLIACSLAGRAPPAAAGTRLESGKIVGTAGPIQPFERKFMKSRFKLKLALATAALSVLVSASASAHVFVTPTEAPADGYTTLTFTVPHGCDGAATNRVTVKMPPQVTSATPGVVPGWSIKTVEGKLPAPVQSEGETITEGVRQVTWSGGPLPDGQLQEFLLSVGTSGEVGDGAEFKVIQDCVGGSQVAWIQTTVEGQGEPEHPAPTVTLVAGEEAGHETTADDGMSESEHASASSNDDSGDDSSNTLSIVALIVGALGLGAGSTALIRSRSKE